MQRHLVLLLVSGSAAADADSTPVPVGAVVSIGVGSTSHDEDRSAVFSAQLDIGYRFRERAMVGIHVAFASAMDQHELDGRAMFDTRYDYTYWPLQLGVGALVMVHDRVYVSPWLGVQRGWRELECRTTTFNGMPGRQPEVDCGGGELESYGGGPALGVSVGGDGILLGDHRFSVSASFTHAFEHDNFSYTTLSLGVAYRFWSR